MGVIEQIKNDIRKEGINKSDYKNHLMNQFSIVQLIALWQGHLEYLVTFHFDDPLKKNPKLKATFSNSKKYKAALNNFGTPGKNGINKLIDNIFNIPDIMSGVNVGGLSNEETLNTLKLILNCRHEVAHTGKSFTVPLNDTLIKDYRLFILELAESFNNEINSLLYGVKG